MCHSGKLSRPAHSLAGGRDVELTLRRYGCRVEKYFKPVVRQAAKVPVASASTSLVNKVQDMAEKVRSKP